jgi:hypothetical protein
MTEIDKKPMNADVQRAVYGLERTYDPGRNHYNPVGILFGLETDELRKMIAHIEKAANATGQKLTVNIGTGPLEIEDKRLLATYAYLARDIGFEVKQFNIDHKNGFATAPMRGIDIPMTSRLLNRPWVNCSHSVN